jgi:hypothetical protein
MASIYERQSFLDSEEGNRSAAVCSGFESRIESKVIAPVVARALCK